MFRKPKLFITDLDGTLVDSEELNLKCYLKAINELGFYPEPSCLRNAIRGNHFSNFLPQVINELSPVNCNLIKKRKTELFRNGIDKLRLNWGLYNLLDGLAKQYPVALATTASRETTNAILETFKMSHLFLLSICGDEVSLHKPAPECYKLIIEHFSVQPEETIVFEDSDIGIEAATAAGAQVIRISL